MNSRNYSAAVGLEKNLNSSFPYVKHPLNIGYPLQVLLFSFNDLVLDELSVRQASEKI